MTSLSQHVERASFVAAVVAGLVGAVAGGTGLTVTAVIAGLVAAVTPIAGRAASQRIANRLEEEARAQIALATENAEKATRDLEDIQKKLRPRELTQEQAQAAFSALFGSQPFAITIAHNMEEGEPRTLHSQLTQIFEQAGFTVSYYGGMTNNTKGIAISGEDSFQKSLVMNALLAAGLGFISLPPSSRGGMFSGIVIWVGTHPGLAKIGYS